MPNLFDPPKTFNLPLSKGGDIYFSFKYMPLVVDVDGNPILSQPGGLKEYEEADFPDGATVQLIIETNNADAPLVADATITGSIAKIQMDKALADTAQAGKLWRAVITYSSGLDKVMCNGLTTRNDGKSLL